MGSVKHSSSDSATEHWQSDGDRPLIYPGTAAPRGVDSIGPLVGRARNTRAARRPLTPSTIMLFLIGMAVAIVLYISNIIAVNQLLLDINSLETEYQEILMEQERLKAQINRMASLERIQERAEAELGLKSLREPPVWLEIDENLIKELEERPRP